jgi:hypothetical protein
MHDLTPADLAALSDADLLAAIAHAEERARETSARYHEAGPSVAWAAATLGASHNPTRRIAKLKAALEADDALAAWELAKAERTRRQLAEVSDLETDVILSSDRDQARALLHEAEAALRRAQKDFQSFQGTIDARKDRRIELEKHLTGHQATLANIRRKRDAESRELEGLQLVADARERLAAAGAGG